MDSDSVWRACPCARSKIIFSLPRVKLITTFLNSIEAQFQLYNMLELGVV